MFRRFVFVLLTVAATAGISLTPAAPSSAETDIHSKTALCWYGVRAGTAVHEYPNGPMSFVVGRDTFAYSFDEGDWEWVGLVFRPDPPGFAQRGYVRRAVVRPITCR